MKQLTVYLAGGMEAESNLGAGWRDEVSHKLHSAGFITLNPCLFEPEQLKGLRPEILPSSFTNQDGVEIYPTHWHDLKTAKRNTRLYERFLMYIRRIIKYDIDIVKNKTDIVLCNWTKGTAKGAGTHSELTTAFLASVPVYIVEHTDSPIPAWALGCSTFIFPDMEAAVEAILADFHT